MLLARRFAKKLIFAKGILVENPHPQLVGERIWNGKPDVPPQLRWGIRDICPNKSLKNKDSTLIGINLPCRF
jgi:hypothetical protein